MKSTVEQLSPTRVRINVEVPFAELEPDFEKAFKQLAQQVRLPGFRPGKAPAAMVRKRFKDAIRQQVIETAIGETTLTTTIEGRKRFPVRVRYAPEYRADPQALGQILVATSNGAQIPLSQVARIEHARQFADRQRGRGENPGRYHHRPADPPQGAGRSWQQREAG